MPTTPADIDRRRPDRSSVPGTALPPGAPGVTELLRAWGAGSVQASDEVVGHVYAELRRQARLALRREGEGHTLQPTALVHEAWLRLDQQHSVRWESRAQFFAVAAQMMRRVLVDHARSRLASKRGGNDLRVTLSDVDLHAVPAHNAAHEVDLLALNDALQKLAAFDSRKAQLVDLRYFGGLSLPEVAAVLGVSLATAGREWSVARMWLRRELDR